VLPPGVTAWVGDLRRPTGLSYALRDVDVVVHAAAAKSGDLHDQLASTVVGTENLIAVLRAGPRRPRLVLISSFAVYDYDRIPSGSVITETSPVIDPRNGRDAYATAKRLQERLVLDVAGEFPVVILRPGVVIGPGMEWNARLGERFGSVWVTFGGSAQVPVITVDNCAAAVRSSCSRALTEQPSVLNLVDPDPPTQVEYLRWLQREAPGRARLLRVPLGAWRALGMAIDAAGQLTTKGLKVPSYMTTPAINARYRKYSYPAARAGDGPGGQPAEPAALTRSEC
jgi:nucleoside-diphosphate-sugar epimerase